MLKRVLTGEQQVLPPSADPVAVELHQKKNCVAPVPNVFDSWQDKL
jgi:hypothetical protein